MPISCWTGFRAAGLPSLVSVARRDPHDVHAFRLHVPYVCDGQCVRRAHVSAFLLLKHTASVLQNSLIRWLGPVFGHGARQEGHCVGYLLLSVCLCVALLQQGLAVNVHCSRTIGLADGNTFRLPENHATIMHCTFDIIRLQPGLGSLQYAV